MNAATQQQGIPNKLNKRHTDILLFASKGFTTRETGERLCLSAETVETYRKDVYKLTGASNITEAVAMALRNGWID